MYKFSSSIIQSLAKSAGLNEFRYTYFFSPQGIIQHNYNKKKEDILSDLLFRFRLLLKLSLTPLQVLTIRKRKFYIFLSISSNVYWLKKNELECFGNIHTYKQTNNSEKTNVPFLSNYQYYSLSVFAATWNNLLDHCVDASLRNQKLNKIDWIEIEGNQKEQNWILFTSSK